MLEQIARFDRPLRRISLHSAAPSKRQLLLMREWLVTNGLGGYASGTIGGMPTRRYHGFLVAALPPPFGRRMLLPHVGERVRLPDGRAFELGYGFADARVGRAKTAELTTFVLEQGLPVWRYAAGSVLLEKRVLMPYLQNSVHLIYTLLDGQGPLHMKLRVAVHNRSHDDPVDTPPPDALRLTEYDRCYEVTADGLPPLRLMAHGRGQSFTMERHTLPESLYATEEARGYEHRGTLTSPGYFRLTVDRDAPAALVASTEPWETLAALAPAAALAAERTRRTQLLKASSPHDSLAAELVLAADQFIVHPVGRSSSAARLRAEGAHTRTVIAGYHWFTDWGRDTMIALEGLALATQRHRDAESILRTFGDAIRDGLIPNLFPEGENAAVYHTADATLWFFHAVDRYVERAQGRALLDALLPKLVEVAEAHLRGTRFGIGVDAADGLLRQGAPGFQLTWMDAKVGDWVVTPRRGKAVEINALWYNALRLLGGWLDARGDREAAARWNGHAQRAKISFNERFWYAAGDYLYDVVDGEDGDDAACRPNQVLSISLRHPILERERWKTVLGVVRERLLTPVGLRSLAPGSPGYSKSYYGDIRSRDAAYHQGTVWPWLLGPFVDAWLKTHPADGGVMQELLRDFAATHLDDACVGSVSEIFDAEPPYTPRGCIAQAWSVAELLRCLLDLESHERG